MRTSFIFSLLLHIAVFLLVIFGATLLPARHFDIDPNQYVIITEVLPISAITNVKVGPKTPKIDPTDTPLQQTEKPEEKPIQEQPQALKSPDASLPASPSDKEKIEEKAPVIEIPDKTKTQPKKVEEKKKDTHTSEKSKSASKDADKKKKKIDDDFTNIILKSLKKGTNTTKTEDSQKRTNTKPKTRLSELMDEAVSGEGNTTYNPELPLSISEIDAIRSQISKTWNTTGFSGGSGNLGMHVIIKAKLDPQGNVINVEAEEDSAPSSNPTYQKFVESAKRAVYTASPLQNLPPERHYVWGELELPFKPSGMVY